MKITHVTENWSIILRAKQILEPLGFEVDNVGKMLREFFNNSIRSALTFDAHDQGVEHTV